jgi:hypothetical protein
MTKRKETHLGTAGTMDHPQLYDSSTERMKPSDNILNEGGRTGEHRDADTIPSATQAPPNIFHQEAEGDAHRMITPSTAGVTVTFSAPSYKEGQASSPSNPNNQFQRKVEK